MKKLLFLILLISFIIICCKTDKQQKEQLKTDPISEKTSKKNTKEITEEIKYVTAKSGLIYRDKPKGERLGKVDFNSKLSITEHTNVFQEIKNNGKTIKAEWLGTKIYGKTVYVFGGFLSDTKFNFPKINPNARQFLYDGIWVDNAFLSNLNRTKSFAKAWGTNIIFYRKDDVNVWKEGDMEELYFKINNNFEIVDYGKIINLTENSLVIELENGITSNFFKVPRIYEDGDRSFEVVRKGTKIVLQKWFAGKYIFSMGEDKHQTTFTPDDECLYYFYADDGGFEAMEIGHQHFKVTKIEGNTYFLELVRIKYYEEDVNEENEHDVIFTGKKATLTKISN